LRIVFRRETFEIGQELVSCIAGCFFSGWSVATLERASLVPASGNIVIVTSPLSVMGSQSEDPDAASDGGELHAGIQCVDEPAAAL
jgi:hypothetical protein